MKLTKLITGLAMAMAAASAGALKADVLDVITFSMTTYTQSPVSDNGIVQTAANPAVKVWTTQVLLNLLARDKFAQGQWGSAGFPAGSKLAISNDQWVVVSAANYLLVDVSDIISTRQGSNRVRSGRNSDTADLAAPTLSEMQVVQFRFDDTAIPGGNNLAFSLQGLMTQSTTDTTPTGAGVYTEVRSGKLTGATGEGTWGDGTPFVCSGSATITGRATIGITNVSKGYAPASLAGSAITVRSGGRTVLLTYGDSTWAQAGTGNDTNVDDYCAGTYLYSKTGPNTALMMDMDLGMLQDLGGTNYSNVSITFTSPTSGSCRWTTGPTGKEKTGSATWTVAPVANVVPATLAGKSFAVTNNALIRAFSFVGDANFTESRSDNSSGYGTYSFVQYSPTVAILTLSYTDGQDQGLIYIEMSFASPTAGTGFFSSYENPVLHAYPDVSGGPSPFTLQQ